MSEYWKSTPKYWCKHCKTYIRDTKLEKANHEATPKHQGNLKRFLRDLHRGHEKDEKDKERAKSEVSRLNGLVSGGGGSGPGASSLSSGFGRGPAPSATKPQATASQRKQQLAQLAEMGVSIPDEFRPDMAMAGEWQVTEQRIIEVGDGEKKPEAVALGVRKRPLENEEDEATDGSKRKWGSSYRTHPEEEDDTDLDALLGSVTRKGKGLASNLEAKDIVKFEPETELQTNDLPSQVSAGLHDSTKVERAAEIKKEPADGEFIDQTITSLDTSVKQEDGQMSTGVVFKKRKTKNIRQK